MERRVAQAPSSAVLVGETHVRNQAYHVLPQPLDRITVQYFNDSDVAIYRDNPTPQLCRQVTSHQPEVATGVFEGGRAYSAAVFACSTVPAALV